MERQQRELMPTPKAENLMEFLKLLKVDELTSLYGENTGICFGSSDEQFKLASGGNLNVKGRWTATLIKENGKWLVASLHASTNLFDNVLLDLAKRSLVLTGAVCLLAGVLIGWLISRRRKRISQVA